MLDYLNEELREVREQSSSLQEEVETYKCGTTSLQEEIETYKCGTTSLQEEIETYKCGTTSLQEELKSYKSGAASAQVMQQELVNLQGQISQLSTLPSGIIGRSLARLLFVQCPPHLVFAPITIICMCYLLATFFITNFYQKCYLF